MTTGPGEVVLDTNVFVAAGFNPGSHSARLVEAVRDGRLRMVWDDATHAEIEHVMRQIPRLSWTRIADLFRSEDRFGGSTHPEAFGFVPDPADRKFAALADAVRAPLVTSDTGLLNSGGQMAVSRVEAERIRPPMWCSVQGVRLARAALKAPYRLGVRGSALMLSAQ
jgi:predicted nucleic acid-binding protein